MWKFGDSMINLHRISNSNGLSEKFFLASLTARETFVNSFPSPENFCSCADKIVSIEWRDLVPRQCTGDCFEIHLPH